MRQLNRYAKWMTIPIAVSIHIIFGGQLADVLIHPSPWQDLPIDLARDAAFGLFIGLLYVAASRWWVHETQWGRNLEDDMLTLLDTRPRSPAENALSSALIEEIIFRGILLQYLGLWAGAAIFAIFHLPTRKSLILWMLSAFAMGVVFGAIFLMGFSLLTPLVAHFAINFLNLHYLDRRQRAAS